MCKQWTQIKKNFKQNPNKPLLIAKKWLKNKNLTVTNRKTLEFFVKDFKPTIIRQYGAIKRIDNDYKVGDHSFWVDGNLIVHTVSLNGHQENLSTTHSKYPHRTALSLVKKVSRELSHVK